MNVSACLVTRGNVDMQPVIDSLPRDWEIVLWSNGERMVWRSDGWAEVCSDLSVYGRYAAIEYATHDLIYVQDDDVIVSDPAAIAAEWCEASGRREPLGLPMAEHIVANMPQEFRHDGYTDSCLVGFGACFHRDLPEKLFRDYELSSAMPWGKTFGATDLLPVFYRTCDVMFTTLAPARVLVDVPKTNREFAEDPDRMYRQPEHVGERKRMLELSRKVRDA